jgi:L-alanine-DL-glutamate epimerase-like enolase superfamily enzyme
MALALPVAGLFSRLRAFAAPHANRVKITDIKVMQIQKIAGNSLIKIETDSGLVGSGEAGVSGPMGRARIEAPIPLPGGVQGIGRMRDLLIGKDPLAIEVHFQNMTSLMHYYMANIPTVSGIDIALWDLAGTAQCRIADPDLRKRTLRRIHSELLPFRKSARRT